MCNVLKNGHLPESKGRAFYRRVSELVLRDDVENEKNDCKTDEGNRKGKYKYFFDAMSCMRKIFHSLLKTYEDSYKLLIMSRVSCSDEFL